MGNGIGRLTVCFTGDEECRRRHDVSVLLSSSPLDEGLGHSFCYVRPDPARTSSSKVHSEETTTTTAAAVSVAAFRSISGASVSANTSTPLSTSFIDLYSYTTCIDKSSTFESSTSFASIPLQVIPRGYLNSGPFDKVVPGSGPMERGFMSGPIERGLFSGPLENGSSNENLFRRSLSIGGLGLGGVGSRSKLMKGSLIRGIKRVISKTVSRGQNSIVAPIKSGVREPLPDWILEKQQNHHKGGYNENLTVSSITNLSSEGSLEEDDSTQFQSNLQWAQGKAGEDRVHVVVSEEHGWVFVGIYDGFNGPDAPDYLLSNLYLTIQKELRGLLWDDDKYELNSGIGNGYGNGSALSVLFQKEDCSLESNDTSILNEDRNLRRNNQTGDACSQCFKEESYTCKNGEWITKRKRDRNSRSKYRGVAKKWEENQRRWKSEWDRERLELDRRLKEQLNRSGSQDGKVVNHSEVLQALSQALKKTEAAYLEIADKMVTENPELALMGSCVLVMLMKGEDVYVMNVGDSRAVLAQKKEPDYRIGKVEQDLERIKEETQYDLESSDWDKPSAFPSLNAFQLSVDHSTSVDEEVKRIKDEHPDDPSAVVNDRVKGSLKVTRAFGAGFLKQPKWNDALLQTFQIDYVGTSPYITYIPSLHHHRLSPKDRFLILSSDGLYQYFTNEEAVAEVELFIELQPEGDPAQHLVEEVLFRAAKKAGMEFHDLLEIPQGDRRRYHDDVSVIVISLEGRIWRSFV